MNSSSLNLSKVGESSIITFTDSKFLLSSIFSSFSSSSGLARTLKILELAVCKCGSYCSCFFTCFFTKYFLSFSFSTPNIIYKYFFFKSISLMFVYFLFLDRFSFIFSIFSFSFKNFIMLAKFLKKDFE